MSDEEFDRKRDDMIRQRREWEQQRKPLEPRKGWRLNGLRHCWERGSGSKLQAIYPGAGGEFSVSVAQTWVEGVWPTFEAAAEVARQESGWGRR